jgi:Ca-activated chloride channel family protein
MNAPNKLGLVRYALRRLVQTLRPDDTIGLVVYAGNAGTVLDPTPVRETERILAAIEQLTASGSTHGSAGIHAAYDLAESVMKPDGVNRIILCSDGDFNVGVTGTALYDLIERKREAGVSLSVFGFGRGNYNDRDMEQMANRGNGNYAFIDKESEAERVLVRGITGTLLTIAKDVKIQVDLNPDLIESYRLIGYENRDIRDDQFRDDSVDAGEIGAGHTVTAFIEMKLAEGYAESAGDIATVKVRWKQPEAGDAADEISHPVAIASIGDAVVEASRAFRLGAAVAEFAEILRQSPHSAHGLDVVLDLARAAIRSGDPDQTELIGLIERAQSM